VKKVETMCDSEEENRQDMLREERESDQRTDDEYANSEDIERYRCNNPECDLFIPDSIWTDDHLPEEICSNRSHRTPEDGQP